MKPFFVLTVLFIARLALAKLTFHALLSKKSFSFIYTFSIANGYN